MRKTRKIMEKVGIAMNRRLLAVNIWSTERTKSQEVKTTDCLGIKTTDCSAVKTVICQGTKTASVSRVKSHNAKEIRTRLYWASSHEEAELLGKYGTSPKGLTPELADSLRAQYGANILTTGRRNTLTKRLAEAFINPFTLVLAALAAISVFTDVIFAAPGEKNCWSAVIIGVMVAISGVLRFVQETRSQNVADQLKGMIHTTACVMRCGEKKEIPMEEIVPGDLVYLSAGDMIPADVRILEARDLFVSQSALTGESEPVEKRGGEFAEGSDVLIQPTAQPITQPITQQTTQPSTKLTIHKAPLTDLENLAFMGSNVISGSAKALVIAAGNETMLGMLAKNLEEKPPKTTFEKGINSVSWVLIRFMLMMVPAVLFINGFTKGDWLQALLFAISVAVGLTPEMLPMIVTSSLTRGAAVMSRKKVMIKNLGAIQNLGSMDILCTDKTGTLTQDRVVLEYHLNVDGEEDERILRHGFLNSYFQTGLKNLIDLAVISRQQELGAGELIRRYTKVDEIPFDFERRRMSVVVRDTEGKTQLVTKGAVEEMLSCCSWAECRGAVRPLTPQVRQFVLDKAHGLNEKGMRVIGVAQKTNPAPEGQFSVADESGMVLMGFLAFLDPPKETAGAAVQALKDYGVEVKVLTGDNDKVASAICSQVGLSSRHILLGEELEMMGDEELAKEAEKVQVFAKLTPEQKARIVRILRDNGHSVGFMGDGINDAAAMRAADVGISVDTAVDIARESAGVVLLEKDLMVLEQGVIEGRKTYANMMKYIKMTASSNFGNMLSVLAASAFLPFLPMAAVQLLLLNLIYDLSCTALSWDNVDPEFLKAPKSWDASGISRFMLWMGPVSSLFDIAAFLLMYFVICPMAAGGQLYHELPAGELREAYEAVFRAGWFIESMLTQALVIHMLRTPKLPFIQSRAAWQVTSLTALGMAVAAVIPFTLLGTALGLAPLPAVYGLWLAAIICGYMVLVTLVKQAYIRRYRIFL